MSKELSSEERQKLAQGFVDFIGALPSHFQSAQFGDWKLEKTMNKSSSGGIKSSARRDVPHLGRWEELTLEDFQFLYSCGVSSE